MDVLSRGAPALREPIRALRTDSLLEIGAGIAGVDRLCSSHHRVTDIDEVRDSPNGRFGAVLIDGFTTTHTSLAHLLLVVARAIELTVYGGAVVLWGVRSLPLLDAAHCAAETKAAPDGMSCAELRERVRQRLRADTELAVHPAAFTALADRIDRVAAVSVPPRHEPAEVPRYDVLVHIGDASPARTVRWLHWAGDGMDLAAIERLLRAGKQRVIGVQSIPNALVLPHVLVRTRMAAAATVGEVRSRGTVRAPAPDDLVALSDGVPYRCRLSAAAGRADGSLDALWCHDSVPDRRHFRWPDCDPEPTRETLT